MTAKHSTLLWYMIFISLAPMCNADEYHSETYGYRIEIPEDWVEIPRSLIRDPLTFEMEDPSYDAGFQPESNRRWLEYPYVLVRPIVYAEQGLDRQINSNDFPEFIKLLTGMDMGEVLKETKVTDAQKFFINPVSGQTQLDTANRRFSWVYEVKVVGIGQVRAFMVGHFGRSSLIEVIFYCLEDEWDQYSDVRERIIDSFRFDPDKAYSVQIATANLTSPSLLTRMLENGVTGFVAGSFAALIIVVVGISIHKKSRVTKSMR